MVTTICHLLLFGILFERILAIKNLKNNTYDNWKN